ncbi:hypothetical protein SLEP1_g27552 [Rubroshorea leprosula]|uniref:Protein kinase domain-containing protein n=1 Tax=Rubroshorea leprosula TaxID=152421 RepID=A0AAV5JTI3_9ROSI|nr:hypothetical protein SLEP1_g27552 [Rubroshorea leprosula]
MLYKMIPLSLTTFLISLLHALLLSAAVAAYNATDIILLDCGATSNTTSLDGRNWEADTNSKYSSFNDPNASFSSYASRQVPYVPLVPYRSALIIHSQFTFNFPVLPGPKFLRLYFYPETYSGLDIATSFFSITANSYTLLNNFSASLTIPTMVPPAASLIKEYVVIVWDSQMLNVTFIPSPGSFAFINAIEIVSMPSLLYARGSEFPLVPLEGGRSFPLDNTTALETMYRLNVGGKQIESKDDTGMYRTWSQDGEYLVASKWVTVYNLSNAVIKYTPDTPEYIAPKEVYTTFRIMGYDSWINMKANMTWNFIVDAGFFYLVRLHFCELLAQVTKRNQHIFSVLINKQMADVYFVDGRSGIPIHKDYIILVGNGAKAKELRLDLHPDTIDQSLYADAFLNGLEIFKLIRTDGSLAGSNPDLIPSPQPPKPLHESSKSDKKSTILPIIGAILGGFAMVSLLVSFFVFQRQRKLKNSLSFTSKFFTTKTSSSLPSDICCHFSIAEIKAATQDFDDTLLIGSGGFGNIYRGIINGGTTISAIKRLNPSSRQGAHEFHTEIAMLSKLRHRHLVSLIGYCEDQGKMILVYDYMARSTLRDHLDKTKNLPLSWKQRLKICIGVARGLHYLHREAKERLTEKSDVYSFGVVLFEVLSDKPPVFQSLSEEKVGLAQWASSCCQKESLDEIVDPYLAGQIAPVALQKFSEVAESCVCERGDERPTMRDIVWALEFTLQLQETVEENTNDSDAIITDERSSENMVKSQSTSIHG